VISRIVALLQMKYCVVVGEVWVNVDPRTHVLVGSHEQKHLLHNWSDCRYRDRPQSPRAILRAGLVNRCPPRT
jgi:hypothetical protein